MDEDDDDRSVISYSGVPRRLFGAGHGGSDDGSSDHGSSEDSSIPAAGSHKVCGILVSKVCSMQTLSPLELGIETDRRGPRRSPELRTLMERYPTRERVIQMTLEEIRRGYHWPPPEPDTKLTDAIRELDSTHEMHRTRAYVAVFEMMMYSVGLTAPVQTTHEQYQRTPNGRRVERNYSYRFRLVRALPSSERAGHPGAWAVLTVDTSVTRKYIVERISSPDLADALILYFEARHGDWVTMTTLAETEHIWLCENVLPSIKGGVMFAEIAAEETDVAKMAARNLTRKDDSSIESIDSNIQIELHSDDSDDD